VYGTRWCPDCIRAIRFLKKHQVAYTWIDLDQHPEAGKKVREINQGMRIVPTILLPDGEILVEPSNKELALKLSSSTT
jgi:glutaredoxin